MTKHGRSDELASEIFNTAFEALPSGTVETLLKPEKKGDLTKVLTYHVVAGRLTFDDLEKQIKKGKGTATLSTVSGGTLTLSQNGPHNISVRDESNRTANISIYDILQSNGVIHAVDKVLLPK